MSEIEDVRKADNAAKWIGDMYPPLWWNLYVGCKMQGFTDEQSWQLLRDYIAAAYRPPPEIRNNA